MRKDVRGQLVGMLLGDGYVNTTNGKRELVVAHGLDQRDYCEHKAGLVRAFTGGKFRVREYRNGPGGRYRCVKFVASHPYFATLKSWMYYEGKFVIARRVLDMLTPEGIAIWYMDDGHAHANVNARGWVSSCSTSLNFMKSESEANVVKDYFAEEHQIEWRVRCLKNRPPEQAFYLECNTAESRKFADIVSPYIIPSMRYKLAHVADLDSHECRAPTGNCCACGATIYDNRHTGLCHACYSRRYYHRVRKHVGEEIVRPAPNKEGAEVVDKEPPR